MNGPDAKLYTDQLTIGYESDLISRICLAVRPGEIMTLIGPNGCGKSTLLKTLCAQLGTRGGMVYLNGADMGKLPATQIARKLSIVMTAQVKPELMTCREMIETGRYPYTGLLGILSDQDHKAVDAAIDLTGTKELAGCYFDTLSDGQKQRVMLARAICQEPEILILDEPTSYLDIKYKLDILDKIKKLAREKGVAVILSLHELEIAMRLSDTVVALGDGAVKRIGTPQEVFTEPFIRSLFGIEGADTEFLGQTPWFADADLPGPVLPARQPAAAPALSTNRAKVLMVQGTMSGAGKSLLVAGLCRIFAQDGYRVAPFKSQNMALNSYITEEGLEMGRAQVVQAECCKIKPRSCMNPILLKPNDDQGSQVIVNGVPIGNMKADAYFAYRKELIPEILQAFSKLAKTTDIIVAEGAGSPVELNLQENDIVNMGLAEMIDASVLLAGDIDRGGIFAQLLGTVSLLSEEDRARICGLIVNKFRGDISLFTDGIRILEEKSGKDVIGVVPYLDVRLDEEDSMTERFLDQERGDVDIVVIRLPHLSNFTDFECFTQVPGVSVRFVKRKEELGRPDLLILPGTKNTVSDLEWLSRSGLGSEIAAFADTGRIVIGICGGYQMLGCEVTDRSDPAHVLCAKGLSLLPLKTVIEREKTRSLFTGTVEQAEGELAALNGKRVKGYEIHMGQTTATKELRVFTSGQTGYCRGNVYGSYVHGLFDLREIYVTILEAIAQKKGVELHTTEALDQDAFKEMQYEKLAAHLREHLDMKKIYEILGIER
ncbi:MAG: cobyric acid synthase [Lachnospiraceae bacterium]|nr:cobyric acid synthase [Lachnospiraceae bacterium]